MFILVTAIYMFARLFVFLICAEAVMSWFRGSFGPKTWKIYNVLRKITEPAVKPFRKLIWRFSPGMGIDFSPVVAILVIEAAARILARIIYTVAYFS